MLKHVTLSSLNVELLDKATSLGRTVKVHNQKSIYFVPSKRRLGQASLNWTLKQLKNSNTFFTKSFFKKKKICTPSASLSYPLVKNEHNPQNENNFLLESYVPFSVGILPVLIWTAADLTFLPSQNSTPDICSAFQKRSRQATQILFDQNKTSK